MRSPINSLLLARLIAVIFTLGLAAGATHRVQKSETFYSISKKYRVSVSSLMSHNGFKDATTLKIGQKLSIPGKSVKVSAKVSRPVYKAKSLRVILDPGHGGRDKGAIWGGVRESDLNLRVAFRVEAELKKKGYPVTMTRRSDRYVSLASRSGIANRYRNAIFVSIHFNATKYTSVRGAETFYVGTRGRYLASKIQSKLVSNLKVRNRGVRYHRYSVLRLSLIHI